MGFDFAAFTNFMSDFLTRLVKMFYQTKAWFAKAANGIADHPYDATDAGEDECILGY